MNHSTSIRLAALITAVVLTAPLHAAADDSGYAAAQRLVVFGDSLSDTGNKYELSGLVNQAPYDGLNPFGVPADPYLTDDGIYYSNGTVWIETLGNELGDFHSARAAKGSWPHASNYAIGGARANPPPVDNGSQHLESQVTAYLNDVDHQIDADVLHVIFIGGNDIVDGLILLGNGTPFQDLIARLGYTVSAVDQNLQRLIDAGARRFLLMNVPDVGLIPAVANPGGKAILSCFSELVNTGASASCPNVPVTLQLPDSLAAVAERLTAQGLDVTAVDVFGFIRGLAQNPASFGFSNVTEKCVSPLVAPFTCSNPNGYLFWDGLHPTQATHRLLAARAINALGH